MFDMNLHEYVDLRESVDSINDLTDEEIESAESYSLTTDENTAETVTTLYDKDDNVVRVFKTDDFDVAVAYLQAAGFDLEDLDYFDYNHDNENPDDPLDHAADGSELI